MLQCERRLRRLFGRGFEQVRRRRNQACTRLVKSRRKQPEFIVLDAKALAAFINSALPQDDGLCARRQHTANSGPLFEGNVVISKHEIRLCRKSYLRMAVAGVAAAGGRGWTEGKPR